MNTLFCRIALVAGCLSLSISAMAYTSTDCTNVEQLATKGVVSYKSTCREYNLDRTITRQEVAAVTLKVGEICGAISNIPPQGQYMCDNVFSDVSSSYPNDWICRVAETLARDGIVSQNDQNTYGDVFFRPLKNVTRAEALAMLMNGANLDFQGTTYDDWRFTGTGAVSWQKPLMQYAYDRDIISSITTFGPNTNAYRRDVFNYAIKAINLCQTNGGNYNYNNNYSNNNCALGQYASGNTCYSCNSLPWNGYYTTRGSCLWECNSGYVKSGNTCVASGYNYGATGQCGTSINSCVSGTFYDTTDYGNYAYWNCTGSNGTAVSCSAYNNGYNYGTTGQCGTSVNSCISGTFYDTTDSGNYAYWNCTGTNGTSVSCSAYNNNYYGTTGQCGTSVNSCVSGTFYDTTDYGNYAYWNCTGTNGTAVSCSAYNSGYNSNNCSVGQYWTGNMCLWCTTKPSSAYYVYSSTETCKWECESGYTKSNNTCVSNNYYGTYGQCGTNINSCISGSFTDTTDSNNTAYWNCTGNNGIAVSCSAYNNNFYAINGQCGSSVNQCITGTFQDTTDSSSTAYWNCNGTNGGNTSYCSASNYSYGTTGQCGYTAGSCTTGYSSNTTYSGGYTYWNCTGTNNVAVSCNIYGNNNYYGTTGQCGSTANTCTTGYVSNTTYNGSNTSWNCTGTNGTYVSCNAYNNNYNNPVICNRPITTNAYYTNSSCWSCNAGFTLINDLCVWWY